jgi:hypothetical protein
MASCFWSGIIEVVLIVIGVAVVPVFAGETRVIRDTIVSAARVLSVELVFLIYTRSYEFFKGQGTHWCWQRKWFWGFEGEYQYIFDDFNG